MDDVIQNMCNSKSTGDGLERNGMMHFGARHSLRIRKAPKKFSPGCVGIRNKRKRIKASVKDLKGEKMTFNMI